MMFTYAKSLSFVKMIIHWPGFFLREIKKPPFSMKIGIKKY